YRFGTGDNWTGLTAEGGQLAQEQSLARARRNQARLAEAPAGKDSK
ncbi:5,10-methylene tetrahydromethanopterin reductase, partial [Dietzia schimae]|nr:5,10-methylene tetrahydromethanopterin reductase [Dietzia kunjamensis subsp. schimae]